MSNLEILKMRLQEKDYPKFSDDELNYYLSENLDDLDDTTYRCLIIKSEDTSLNISGLSTGDSSGYFKRLAQQYRKSNSGILI